MIYRTDGDECFGSQARWVADGSFPKDLASRAVTPNAKRDVAYSASCHLLQTRIASVYVQYPFPTSCIPAPRLTRRSPFSPSSRTDCTSIYGSERRWQWHPRISYEWFRFVTFLRLTQNRPFKLGRKVPRYRELVRTLPLGRKCKRNCIKKLLVIEESMATRVKYVLKSGVQIWIML